MGGTGEPRQAIVSEVAAREDVSASDLPPLYEYVEPDGLASIVAHGADNPAADVSVQFEYADYEVTVAGSGEVSVDRPDAGGDVPSVGRTE